MGIAKFDENRCHTESKWKNLKMSAMFEPLNIQHENLRWLHFKMEQFTATDNVNVSAIFSKIPKNPLADRSQSTQNVPSNLIFVLVFCAKILYF